MSENPHLKKNNFIREIIEADIAAGSVEGGIVTRFPPEPNGYLHIGHAKSIFLNFSLAEAYGGRCNLRFDDTNPSKEEQEYIDSMIHDIRWLGYDWENRLFYASDYFEEMYLLAEELITAGKAYVDDLSGEEIREFRGTLTEPGRESPHRQRSIEQNLQLFRQMRAGEFPDGAKTLRAKIDMKSGNLNMRDPVMYRILRAKHPRTGTSWCIYPTYDWAHCLEDSIEGITHSICTLEFEDHRPLYDWFIDQFPRLHHPRQIEFARLNISNTVLSKRWLLQLITEEHVEGWDDPRMPTLSGLRRRGFTPSSIREFCHRVGVSKVNGTVDYALLEHCLREELNKSALRLMVVMEPLKVTIVNFPPGEVEWVEGENNPEDDSAGSRKLPFQREIYIERDDFRIDVPNKKYFRLAPGREIRLKHAYYIKCNDYIQDPETGEVTELLCTYDPESKGGWTNDGRKVRGTSHWVSAAHSLQLEARLFDPLFSARSPDLGSSISTELSSDTLTRIEGCLGEPSIENATLEGRYQFLRQGYFCMDPASTPGRLIFNRTVSLRGSWVDGM